MPVSLGAQSRYAGNSVLAQEQTDAAWSRQSGNGRSGENEMLSRGLVVMGYCQRFLEIPVTANPQPAGCKTVVGVPRGEVDTDARSPSSLPWAEGSGAFPCVGPGSGLGGSEATAAGLC